MKKLLSVLITACWANVSLAQTAAETVSDRGQIKGIDSGYLLNSFLALVIVIGIIFAAAWLLRKTRAFDFAGNKQMKIVEVLAFGTKEKLVVVQCNDEYMLLGVTAHNINLIEKLQNYKPTAAATTPTSFNQLFNKYKHNEQ